MGFSKVLPRLGCLLLVAALPARATETVTSTLTLTITTVAACTTSAPATINLGQLRPNGNTNDHTAFTVTVSCSDTSLSTALYARAIGTGVNTGDDEIPLKYASGATAGSLWLTEESGTSKISLDGGGATETAKRFCGATTGKARTCSLVPHSRINAGAANGSVSAAIRFDVVYP